MVFIVSAANACAIPASNTKPVRMKDVISAKTESTEQRGRTSADPKGIDGQCHGQGSKHTRGT